MLNYQSTSFHDAQVMRQVLGLRAAPEFEVWLEKTGICAPGDMPGSPQRLANQLAAPFAPAIARLGTA